MMGIHPVAAAGFASSAGAYERGRPGYPRAAIAWLAHRLPLRAGMTVVDLAAGTGKLSRPLAATGARVIAIEPLEAMRRSIGAEVQALDGTAEAIPLDDASTDAVTVGQAFHWFDGAAALGEIHRILRPGGSLALIWNKRRMEDPIHASIERLIEPHMGAVPRHGTGAWREAFHETDLFGASEQVRFEHEQLLDKHELQDRIGSTSAIAALAPRERAGVLDRVGALAGTGRVRLRYTCEIHLTQRNGRA